jgi:diguanylate cyclase (GGDEF)-like protein
MVILLALLDAGFARTTRLASRQAAGIDYAEQVRTTQETIASYQIGMMTSMSADEDESREMMTVRLQQADEAIAGLISYHESSTNRLSLHELERDMSDESVLLPGQIGKTWSTYRAAPSNAALFLVLDRLHELGSRVLDISGATQAPDLVTSVLVRGIMVNLSQYSLIVSRAISSPQAGIELLAYRELLENLASARIGSLLSLAFANDTQQRLAAVAVAHERFVESHVSLTGSLTGTGDADQTRILSAADTVVAASRELYAAGSAAIRTAVDEQLRRILWFRVSAIGASSLVFALVGWLLVWIRKTISRSVDGLIDYTRRIADGDSAAKLRVEVSEDLEELYRHTTTMVDSITQLAEFPRRNPNGVLAVEPSGEVRYVNPAAQRLAEELGTTVQDLLPGQHADIVRRLSAGQAGNHIHESTVRNVSLEWAYHRVAETGMVHVYFKDITDRKRAEEQILHDAFHDSLTGLPNRALLLDRLEQSLSLTGDRAQMTLALILLDIDRFKVINDSLGHERGDDLLRAIAQRLADAIGASGTVARLGGDEFGVLLPAIGSSRRAVGIANRIHQAVREPLEIAGTRLTLSASIGLVLPGPGDGTPVSLLRDADTAMYQAKNSGRARTEIFNAAMHQDALNALQTEAELAKAIEDGRIEPFYQPIVDLKTGRIAGFEALARWIDPEKGVISPGRFITLAEESGLIVPLGRQIMEKAIDQACVWRRSLRKSGELVMSVNLSVKQFAHPGLVDEISEILSRHEVTPHCIKLEITESGLMGDVETSMRLMRALKELQVQLGIDDFGTGYSSLSYLHRFPFDILKVDQSFVSRMEAEHESREIVTNIISLAHGLSKDVIAEGIETEVQMREIASLGSEFGQGYYFSRPLPAEEAEALLASDPSW